MSEIVTSKTYSWRDLLRLASITFCVVALSAAGADKFWLPRNDWVRPLGQTERGLMQRNFEGKIAAMTVNGQEFIKPVYPTTTISFTSGGYRRRNYSEGVLYNSIHGNPSTQVESQCLDLVVTLSPSSITWDMSSVNWYFPFFLVRVGAGSHTFKCDQPNTIGIVEITMEDATTGIVSGFATGSGTNTNRFDFTCTTDVIGIQLRSQSGTISGIKIL